MLGRVAAILSAPDAEWPVIEREETGAIPLAIYVAALATIPAVARFIGGSLVGTSTSAGVAMRVPASAGLLGAVVEYALAFVTVLIVAIIGPVLRADGGMGCRCECQRDRVVGDGLGAVVRHVAHRDPARRRSVYVDRVHPDAIAPYRAQPRQGVHDLGGDLRVLDKDGVRAGSPGDHLCGCA